MLLAQHAADRRREAAPDRPARPARVESLPTAADRVRGAPAAHRRRRARTTTRSSRCSQRALDEAGDDHALRAPGAVRTWPRTRPSSRCRNVAVADGRAAEAVDASASGSASDQRLAALHPRRGRRALRGRPVDDLARALRGAVLRAVGYLARTPGAGRRPAARVARGDRPRPAHGSRRSARSPPSGASPSPYALARLHLCELELRLGRLGRRAASSSTSGPPRLDSSLLHWPMYERCRSLLAAGRGDAEDARELGRARRRAGRGDRDPLGLAGGDAGTRAWRPCSTKDPTEAVRHLRAVWAHTRDEGVLDPGAFPAAPDLVEALVETGDLDDACTVVDALRRDSPTCRTTRGRGSAPAAAPRLVAPRGRVVRPGGAGARRRRQRRTTSAGCASAEAARTWLALGRAQRRARKWGAARDSLERAVAPLRGAWARPAGPTTRARTWSGSALAARASAGRLTTTERRVADLAVAGAGQQGDRADAGGHRQHGRVPPAQHLRQARHPVPVELAPRLTELDDTAVLRPPRGCQLGLFPGLISSGLP